MPYRHTPPEGAVAYPLAARGVYVSHYLVKGGKREVYAVDSRGEQIAVVYVADGMSTHAAEELCWATLHAVDPIQPHERGPDLRLVRD